eukprot:CAMPEP_0116890452 /NCGR_PEP_ID=MMETSP0467-20121206/992_1 /TAXON_ID=283647 /ORGANISM="Mesodinium pulex, Strain SPMC105" /LENGTH=276 /DNA_ID=CAMNT_0004558229 /DNA_START=183 /DNA_END=1014 /DNA_ORIENTATION=+
MCAVLEFSAVGGEQPEKDQAETEHIGVEVGHAQGLFGRYPHWRALHFPRELLGVLVEDLADPEVEDLGLPVLLLLGGVHRLDDHDVVRLDVPVLDFDVVALGECIHHLLRQFVHLVAGQALELSLEFLQGHPADELHFDLQLNVHQRETGAFPVLLRGGFERLVRRIVLLVDRVQSRNLVFVQRLLAVAHQDLGFLVVEEVVLPSGLEPVLVDPHDVGVVYLKQDFDFLGFRQIFYVLVEIFAYFDAFDSEMEVQRVSWPYPPEPSFLLNDYIFSR